MMPNLSLTVQPSKIDFDKISISQIQKVLSSGDLSFLSPEERLYYDLMETVRGLNARMKINSKLVTKAGIIKLLKQAPYSLSDWMARQVYSDSINFFYAQDNIRSEAFANLYADKLEKWADACFLTGNVKEAKNMLVNAAKLRGCYRQREVEIPEELLNQKTTVIYTTKREDLGVPAIDKEKLKEVIDAIPEIPIIVKDHLKEDARLKKMDLKKRMLYDQTEFVEEEDR